MYRYFVMQIEGGLGNQMFQYAFGRYLAIHHNASLYFDMTRFGVDKRRPYTLGVFDIHAQLLTPEQGRHFASMEAEQRSWLRVVRKIGRNVLPGYFPRLIDQKVKHFEPQRLHFKPSAYLRGFWQSEKHFASIRPQLLQDFTIQSAPEGRNKEVAEQIQSTTAISLHVRRGDYVSSQAANAIHGTCSLEYYKQALEYVTSRCEKPTVYIFSDDPQWTRENLCPDLPCVYVDHNDPDHGYEDMRLMSLCHHNITANSSFSWWGAWLNEHADKIVCCPQKWYSKVEVGNKDIQAQGWIQL